MGKKTDKNHLVNKLMPYAADIFENENFQGMQNNIQHGAVTTYDHVLNVAGFALKINKRLKIKCDEKQLVRGALLHDYFLYDWHDKRDKNDENRMKHHGVNHPKVALRNAMQDYDLTHKEKDCIRKHMWPLTLGNMPACREAWVVSLADKCAAVYETLLCRRG
jgi:uncharacterized protein